MCDKLISRISSLLEKGDIPSTDLDIYFSNCKSDEEIIKKTFLTLNKYYTEALVNEKYLINNLLFMLESLTDKKTSLKNFIKRTLDFNIYEALKNDEAKKSIDFLLYKNSDENTTYEAIKEILQNPSFYQINNIIPIIWSNKIFYVNKSWLNLFDNMTESLNKLIEKNDIEKVMSLHFFIYHTYGNNIQTTDEWRKFNELVEIPASKFYKKIGDRLNLHKSKKRVSTKKKKIAIILDRLVLNSPFIVTYSLIKSLASNTEFNKNYEIYIYSLNYINKNPENQSVINALSPFVKKIFTQNQQNIYYNHLQKAIEIRNEIIDDKIDYLITMASGYDINNFIITNRSAPKQIFWTHGNCAFDIPNIDIRISHFEQECKEFNWKIFNAPMAEEFLIGPEESKQKAEILKESLLKQFGEKTIFLGTIGRLVKLESEEYLKVISEIMKQNPNTVYLACGSGNQKKVEGLMQKVDIDLKRVIFTGQVDPHMFGWIIDVWPDTFPLRQGQSKNEYIAKGGVVVFMDKYLNDTIRNWYNDLKIKPIAKDEKDYIKLINNFINDKNLLKKISEYNKTVFKNQHTDFSEIL